jgi:signal transduction histidine kinase
MSVNFSNLVDLILSVILLSILPLGFAVFFVLINRKNHNGFLREKFFLKQDIENQLLMSKLEIHENTLKSISLEINDHIGQVLSLIRLNLFSLESKYKDPELEEANKLIGQVITDLRNLSQTNNAELILKDGLNAAIEIEVKKLEKNKQFEVLFSNNSNLDFLPLNKGIIIFRMIQEALQNIMKHAGANKIEISIKNTNSGSMISISDDGKGFNTKSEKSGCMGISSLKNRAKILGAKLELFSFPGAGTNIIIHVKK